MVYLLHRQHRQHIRMYVFWRDMFFNSSISIVFTWFIQLFLLSKNSFFLFFLSQTYSPTKLTCVSFEPWIFRQFPYCYRVSFYILFPMLQMLVTKTDLKHIICHREHVLRIPINETSLTKPFWSVSS